jgi:hypothetical protein
VKNVADAVECPVEIGGAENIAKNNFSSGLVEKGVGMSAEGADVGVASRTQSAHQF